MNRAFIRTLAAGAAAVAVLGSACSGGGGGGGGTEPQTGSISGQVTAAGQGVGGVTVGLVGTGNTTTAANGSFSFASVPAGQRELTITLPGGMITSTVAEGITKTVNVSANQTASVSWTLKPGRMVVASGTSFSPENLTVTNGTTVRWVNTGGTHTVTPSSPQQAGAWASANLGPNASFEHTFDTNGAYNYFCAPHQQMGMTGSVTVQ